MEPFISAWRGGRERRGRWCFSVASAMGWRGETWSPSEANGVWLGEEEVEPFKSEWSERVEVEPFSGDWRVGE